MNHRYKNRIKNISDMFQIEATTQTQIFQYVIDLVQNNSCQIFFRKTNIYFKSNQNLTNLLDKIELLMRDIDIKTPYSSQEKSRKYRFLLDRITTRWKKNNTNICVQHPTKPNFLVSTSNVIDRNELTH